MILTVGPFLLLCRLVASLEADVTPLSYPSKPIAIPKAAPVDAGLPLDSFVSFSFELSSWPDFAGNLSHPNNFSYNLMKNIGKLQGSMPIARVGGNTHYMYTSLIQNFRDIAIFDESQKTGLIGIIRPNISADYPTVITIGPSFFESYQTMPQGTKFTHGFNMGANSSAARSATWASVSYACKAIGSNIDFWEYGNEPDLFAASGYRPWNWTELDYVSEWINGTSNIEAAVKKACPDLSSTKFMAPSFAGVAANDYFTLGPVEAWKRGLNKNRNVGIVSSHNYMGVSTSTGITLQGTLMNHSNIIVKADAQLNVSQGIKAQGTSLDPNLPFILGEHNSLARQGRPGLSNSFGAALWGVDWNLYLASKNISRSHMHQGTNYRYQSWQPIQTNLSTKGTKPPYYGNLAVAAFLHKPSPSARLHISHLDSSTEYAAQYAAYTNNTLTRLVVIDLHTYNTTANNFTTPFTRPEDPYMFQVPSSCKGEADVKRLMAEGSDATTGISWDGYSFDYELGEGRPVRMANAKRGEKLSVREEGMFSVQVPWSSVAIIELAC
ncbi:glycoside hydrolase family 79 [Pyrenophora seminiperda CCB06]|uniref:Glycoside hydrolase family 79 n=1 Tax=Pyrenophora seminiperda CCB06 TaxID=1302712 RepID=A0A3M7MHY9_9PLEO|nr:glycoside hydrolase family 79 [Pyrenophora seminiperda CCB06]